MERGADPVKPEFVQDRLRFACYKGNWDMIQLLLSYGGDINVGIYESVSCYAKCSFKTFEKFMSLPDIDLSSVEGHQSLLDTALSRNPDRYDKVRLLLERGAEYNTNDWATKLFWGVNKDSTEILAI